MSRKKDKLKNAPNVVTREDVTIRVPPPPTGELRSVEKAASETFSGEAALIPWYRQTFTLAAASGLLLWAAFPPLGLSLLAWIAPLGWLRLIQQEKLLGKRPYLAIWFAGFLHWLAVMQGVRLAHPILYLGWFALTAYLAVYMALFVGITRVAVHRLRLPLMLAAPVIWVGLETIRSYFLTGFALALLGHTQARWPVVIQIADIFGAYGVSFAIMFVAACLASIFPPQESGTESTTHRTRFAKIPPAAALVVALAGVFSYGIYGQLTQEFDRSMISNLQSTKIALIQESIDTIFEYNPDRNAETFDKYRRLTLETSRQHPGLALVVWPESMLSANSPAIFYDEKKIPPQYLDAVSSHALRFENKARQLLSEMHGPSLLAGCDARELDGMDEKVFNSAILFDRDGKVKSRYSKMHRVMFGEYIPVVDSFPWLYRFTPIQKGLEPGQRPECFEAAGLRIMPCVCFESTVPHLIRRQFNELARDGLAPDVMVNVSNDGWFWGSSILDLHLACSIFRAVEMRRPVLIAANTGITAAIDGNGRVQQELPRRTSGVIVLNARKHRGQRTFYAAYGDLAAWLCMGATIVVALVGMRRKVGR